MESFALYLFKSVIWLAGFALVFILFLRNERFFFLEQDLPDCRYSDLFFFPAYFNTLYRYSACCQRFADRQCCCK